ncbi:PadR family transcriptional regulator [Stackebrandtia nassauensis]|uniref:Transcriptional regulator, PadR-like family n=1 Tax=Stackebrandtia nassauensis (strain DSM 44728 / CIP 108903 / NRRL B-16338 / NBRC 102104 / LLR-40K-21) TaxID=446470 RepID=D3Q7Q5_STANL|nr:helix-turn-helix transcriptional regulator [Stackebrandtia nassauensis]ADD44397.1 transcriptional regulator, PadR-like family [Stackebrandtia nassauensis DSM 44728]
MAGRRTGPDLVALTVLAILSRGPRHAYDLHRFIVDTHKDYVTGLPRSLYHAVARLADDGHIAPVETSRAGRRPERTVYELTATGETELTHRLQTLLTTIGRDTTGFVAALSLMGGLPRETAASALRERAAALRTRVEGAKQTLADLTEHGVPRLPLLELEYEHSRYASELDWVERILADLHNGTIDWEVPLPPTTA